MRPYENDRSTTEFGLNVRPISQTDMTATSYTVAMGSLYNELLDYLNGAGAAQDEGHADPVERQNSKPDFQALIYPGRSGDIQPVKTSPPVFLACGFNDRQDISEGLAEAYLRFRKAGVPAELHIYSGAGHGFGLRSSNKSPVGAWPERFIEWLDNRKLLAKP